MENNFIKLVKDMRDAQKSYFKSRSRDDLIKSKNLETLVDKEIKLYEAGVERQAGQQNLFSPPNQ